jgi:hypothetical protein
MPYNNKKGVFTKVGKLNVFDTLIQIVGGSGVFGDRSDLDLMI